jgi:uncharacterized membrane protein
LLCPFLATFYEDVPGSQFSTYGLAFFSATAAFAFLSTNHWLEGTIWTGFLLVIVALVVFFLSLLVKEFKGDRS